MKSVTKMRSRLEVKRGNGRRQLAHPHANLCHSGFQVWITCVLPNLVIWADRYRQNVCLGDSMRAQSVCK